MDDDFFRREYDLGPQKRDHLFIWTIFIILLTGAVLASWLGSIYIFGHPEIARNYKILARLHKIDAPKRFDYTAAPPGDFFTPQKIYEKYAAMPDAELQLVNAQLLRDFIRNYQSAVDSVPYLTGQFTMVSSRELKGSDLFPSGVVALGQCNEYPQVLLEYVYTAQPSNVGYVKQSLAPGTQITPQRPELSPIIHIEKLADGRLLLTAMPITYGSYTLKNGAGEFSLDPPTTMHLEGGVPITKSSAIPPAGKNYAARASATPAETEESATPSATPVNPQLVRVMPPAPISTPKPGSHATPPSIALETRTPQGAIATPPPVPIAQETPPPSTPVPAMAENETPTPAPFFTPSPAMSPDQATQTPTPAMASETPPVQLQPFIEAESTPAVTAGAWKTFRPGQMPRGKLLKISEAAGLADKGTGGEQLYLSGQFVVTASNENNAVLRAKGGMLSALNPLDHSTNSIRVYVEFPAGLKPPTEGSTISRDEMRPFEIQNVQRERDGTIDVMVREITAAVS